MALSEAEELELLELEEQDAAGAASAKQSRLGQTHDELRIPTNIKKSVGLGAAQGLTLGFGDEGAGAIAGFGKDILSGILPRMESYRNARDQFRETFREAKSDNPKSYVGGELVGSVGTLPFLGGATVPRMMALGAAQGLGNSEADLTRGDVGGAVRDTTIGGILGGLLGKAGNTISKAISIPGFEDLAQTRAAKALGYTKRFFKDPKQFEKAKKVGQTMLDEGVISPGAGAEEMMSRVQSLASKSGSQIGKFLKGIGGGFDPEKAIDEIESLRPQFRGGDYKVVHKALDRAIDTIKAHGSGPLSFEETNTLKGLLQEAGKFNTNSEALNIGTRRLAAGKFRASMDQQLEDIASNPNVLQTRPMTGAGNSPMPSGGAYVAQTPAESLAEFNQFLRNKKVYGATQEAEDALTNRLGSQIGNKEISLTDVIAAAPVLATGNPIGALGLWGLKRGAERYGNQITAVAANKAAQASRAVTEKIAYVLRTNPKQLGNYADTFRKALQNGTLQSTLHEMYLTQD